MTPNERANQVLLQLSFEGRRVIEEAEFLTVREIELAQAYLELETRIQKLEAVAEAAKDMAKRHNWTPGMGQCICPQHNAFYESIAELEQP